MPLHSLKLPKKGTVVFTTSTTSSQLALFLQDDYNFESCLRLLSLEDQLKVRNTKHQRHKALVLRLFAKIVLNHALAEPDPWKDLEYKFNEFGKPSLKHFQFNSSSSNDLAAIVVDFGGSVGVDLSHQKQAISQDQFMDQFAPIFAKDEKRQLNAIEDSKWRYVVFNQFWTLKEAFTKYLGCGLNVDLSLFFFHLLKTELEVRNSVPLETLEYKISWQKGTTVDFRGLKEANGCPHLYCYSGVLVLGDPLPVIISIISETIEDGKTRNFHLDFLEILKQCVE